MTVSPDPKLVAMHLCDAVERDVRNLPNIVSVYPGVVRCATRPAFLPLTVFAAFELPSGDGAKIEMLIKGPGSTGGGDAEITDGIFYFDIDAKIYFLVKEEGEVSVQWRVPDKKWSKPRTWRIRFADNARECSEEETDQLRKLFRATLEANEILEGVRSRPPRY